MSKTIYVCFALVLLLIITGCSNSDQAKEVNNEIEEEKQEVVEFESVEDAELYLWESAKKDRLFSEVEKILADGSFVSKSDYQKLVAWYKDLESTNEIVQNANENMKDWKVEDSMSIHKDGGIIARTKKQVSDELRGYGVEFVSEDDTYKLKKLTFLQ
ncbi:hypothetical protein [Metabacillus fastidiosus]|uniref:Uncharacterized protein n=1 Tax=Metabacillus fastidiosus TaxID=1458 RepID=A0ABU6P2X9_9BACI|nr:hypothetical protein [Metabacillus fastidiosus]